METDNGRIISDEIGGLISTFQDQLFRFAFFRTGSLADAQDIVQDVFVKLYKSGKITAIKNIKHYLLRSISNACKDFTQRKKKHPFETIEKLNGKMILKDDEAMHSVLIKEEFSRINNVLKTLPYEQAEVIRMKIIDELNFVEIAHLMEVPVTTVKSRFKYGIDKLKTIVHSKKKLL